MDTTNTAVITQQMSHIEERITELAGNYNALQKSYFVLNEHHHQLEMNVMTLRAELATVKAIIQWCVTPTILVGFILQLARIGGIIN